MAKTPRLPALLVTGSTGRLGGLLQAVWAKWPEAPIRPIYAARADASDCQLHGDGPLPDLPRCDMVIALWGDTTGTATGPASNAALAHRSRAVAQACGATRVLHFSSAAVYGPGTQMSENAPPAPINPYGQSKLLMETAVAGFAEDDMRHCCLRLANTVGADSLAPALCAHGPVTLDRFADGHGPQRSYIAPGDLAHVLAALALLPETALPATLNIAAPEPVAMADLAYAAGQEIRWRTAPPSATQTVSLDTSALHALLPGLSLRRSAADMIADWHSLKGA